MFHFTSNLRKFKETFQVFRIFLATGRMTSLDNGQNNMLEMIQKKEGVEKFLKRFKKS